MSDAVQLYQVTLTKDHTHDSREYKAGDRIEVNAADRDYLVTNDIGQTAAAH